MARSLRILRSNDLDTVSVFDLVFNRYQLAIDTGSYHTVTDCAVYTIGKINRCRTIRKVLDISLWSKTIYAVRKQIKVIFQQAHELSVI